MVCVGAPEVTGCGVTAVVGCWTWVPGVTVAGREVVVGPCTAGAVAVVGPCIVGVVAVVGACSVGVVPGRVMAGPGAVPGCSGAPVAAGVTAGWAATTPRPLNSFGRLVAAI